MSIENIADAARSEITIAGVCLSVPAPFLEGHVCRANEAAVMNQTYAENIRNNFATKVKAAVVNSEEQIDPETGEVTPGVPVDLEILQMELDEYILSYDFGVRRSGSVRAPVDPIEREAMKIATMKVKEALRKQGHKIGDIPVEKIRELAAGALEQYPQIREHAKQIVALTAAAAEDTMTFDLG